MGLFKKKPINVEEEEWKKEVEKKALKGAREKAEPILIEKIQQKEVDRLTGAGKGKLMEKLGKEFKPLGDLATKEKMDRLLGTGGRQTGTNMDRMLGRDRQPIQVIQVKGENFRKNVGYDAIDADSRVEKIMGRGEVVKDKNLKEAAYYEEGDFKEKVKRMVKR